MPTSQLSRGSTLIRLWFVANAIVLMLPPLHWLVNDHQTPIAGLAPTLFYFIAVCISITASVVAAYMQESEAGELQ